MDRAVAYWVTLAEEDFAIARDLRGGGHHLGAAYHCQQALEKMLKALIQQRQADPPPRTHDLVVLADEAGVWSHMPQGQRDVLRTVGPYGIEARYPTVQSAPLGVVDERLSGEVLAQTGEVMAWLRARLTSANG